MTKVAVYRGLGVVFERYEPDPPGSGHDPAPVPRDLTNDGTTSHGGVIASVMDTAGAARPGPTTTSTRHARATVAMSIQYTGAANAATWCVMPHPRAPQGTHVHRDHRYRCRRQTSSPTPCQNLPIV